MHDGHEYASTRVIDLPGPRGERPNCDSHILGAAGYKILSCVQVSQVDAEALALQEIERHSSLHYTMRLKIRFGSHQVELESYGNQLRPCGSVRAILW